MPTLDHIADRLRHVFNGLRPEALVAGAIVAVEIGQQRLTIPYGTANLNTGQPFTEDTGFLLGSVTKILITTALMRLVDRGAVDLDEPVIGFVPEFSLDDVDAAEKITVRMLVNHTSGIDVGGLAFNSGRGRDAYGAFIDFLPKVGVIFEPGSSVHYSNAGFVLAGRMIEQSTGLPFDRAIREEIFEPAGMVDATLAHGQAVLRRTAVGAFAGAGVGLRATSLFSRPESNAPAGSTPVVTATDMLAYGRIHRRGGRAATGRQVLSRDLVDLMRYTNGDAAYTDFQAGNVDITGYGAAIPQAKFAELKDSL